MGQDASTITVTKSDSSLLQAVAAPRRAAPCLILYSGGDAGLPFDLEPGTAVIGRAADAEIHVDHPGVSRRHAEIDVGADGTAVLRDLGSINGTWINEQRVAAAVRLVDGDMVRVGVLVLRFHASHSLEAALHDRIWRTATVDSVTEVFNRRHLLDVLKRELRLARRRGEPLALACFDLDHFKRVNDVHGHPAGDAVLRDSAALMRAATQDAGVFGRLGGEEFALVLPRCHLGPAVTLAEAACAAVGGAIFRLPNGTEHRQTVSAGVAVLTDEMTAPVDLVAAADERLYAAKHAGRNRIAA